MSQSLELQQCGHGLVIADSNDGHVVHDVDPPPYIKPRLRWWDVKGWSRRRLVVVLALALTAFVIIVIVVPVEVEQKKNAYPHYSKLDYSVVDSCLFIYTTC